MGGKGRTGFLHHVAKLISRKADMDPTLQERAEGEEEDEDLVTLGCGLVAWG